MAVLDQIEPKEVFRFFEEMCAIPHGTFDTKRISDYCAAFAKERGLEYIQDSADNVIIKKPGSAGYEDSEPVIIQGHLDMVCEKRPGSDHDFKKDGLKLVVEDGYVKTEDTTLGGDDGIAVAIALAVLDSSDLAHPPIEAVFTSDEEEGMGGANAIDLSVLKGRRLFNIDSDVEGILTTGCAGGYRYEAVIPAERVKGNGATVEIRIHGLSGGHSGTEIHKQRGNAHKLMARFLNHIASEVSFHLADISGGSKDNVIAMECTARIVISESDVDKVKSEAEAMKKVWAYEFMDDEPGLAMDVSAAASEETDVFDADGTSRILSYLTACPCGAQGFSRKIEGLTETSLNLGILTTGENYVKAVFLVRSSVESKKTELKEQLDACGRFVGAEGKVLNEYPAWQYDPDSKLRKVMEETYKEMFGKEPVVSAVHAGLECGLFIGKLPDLDCVSFGPDILNIHSFNEALSIASTERMWNYLTEVLARLK